MTILPWAILLLLAVPTVVFTLEVLAGLWRARHPLAATAVPHGRPRIAVLIPAHNESSGITATLQSVMSQLQPHDRVLVVADNCTDDTAQVARSLGADVVERFHPTLRGKGHALAYGVNALRADPPAMLLMVDADCVIESGAMDALAARCHASSRPVQSRYLMNSPAGASLKTRVAEFAWRIKNQIRPAGASVLGWPCHLTGSGMLFPWELIADAPLASSHLVEDMQLGVALSVRGFAPVYCDEARVHSTFPVAEASLSSQRKRWEHGHLAMMGESVPVLWREALAKRSWRLLGLGLDLCVPPFASLLLLLSCALAFAALASLLGASAQWLVVSAMLLAACGVAVTGAWWQVGQTLILPRELMTAPTYVLGKITVYFEFFTKRQASWVRTGRDHER